MSKKSKGNAKAKAKAKPIFKIVAKPDVFKKFLIPITTFSGELGMEINEGYIRFAMMEESHVAFVDVKIGSRFFDEYRLKKDIKSAINQAEVESIVKFIGAVGQSKEDIELTIMDDHTVKVEHGRLRRIMKAFFLADNDNPCIQAEKFASRLGKRLDENPIGTVKSDELSRIMSITRNTQTAKFEINPKDKKMVMIFTYSDWDDDELEIDFTNQIKFAKELAEREDKRIEITVNVEYFSLMTNILKVTDKSRIYIHLPTYPLKITGRKKTHSNKGSSLKGSDVFNIDMIVSPLIAED